VREKRFKVVFAPAAVRDVEALEVEAALQVVKDVKSYLESRPFPIGYTRVKKLVGFDPPLFRLRSGDYRVYYRIPAGEVVVLAVTVRKDSGKRLRRISEKSGKFRGGKT
jgi:mRNA-degrading endonuclease RelE of RelBE toxin-antitoxin system